MLAAAAPTLAPLLPLAGGDDAAAAAAGGWRERVAALCAACALAEGRISINDVSHKDWWLS